MFGSIIDNAEVSNNAKMQHLQNAVPGRAKDAIAGYGFSGELYTEALQKFSGMEVWKASCCGKSLFELSIEME